MSLKTCKLWDLIPQEELDIKLKYGMSELDPEFLCFEHVYFPVSQLVPKDFTIVDLGCNQAAQCYFFKDHKEYIGVDRYDKIYDHKYIPPLRFMTANTTHYVMNLEEYLDYYSRDLNPDKTYYIMSYVPSHSDDPKWLSNKVKNYLWVYCSERYAQGIAADEIVKAIDKGRGRV